MADFVQLEAAGGFLLMATAVVALVLANSPAAPAYRAWLAVPLGLPGASLSVLAWINDGLMAIFFLLVGLEIKRELLAGELASRRQAVLPGVAALGGMVVPALIYAVCTWRDPVALHGWSVPAATDIAFALSVLALLGSRIPPALKVFLTALAILDDLAAIVIIGVFYTPHVSLVALAAAAGGIAVLLAFNRAGLTRLAPYLVVGVFVWGALLASGIHPTLAGVAVAFTIPLRGVGATAGTSPLHRLEHRLHPWVAYLILPIFGLANAGLALGGIGLAALAGPVPLGVAAGLFFGKQIGVMSAAWLAVRCHWARWPDGSTPVQLYGVALLCGIGFTMSVFIGGLAFAGGGLQDQAKLGVFVGSIAAGLAGYLVLRVAAPSAPRQAAPR